VLRQWTRDLKQELPIAFEAGRDRPVRLATVTELGSFRGEPARCFKNARRWVSDHTDHEVVEGWLQTADCVFVRHAVVRTPTGELLDITPREPGTEMYVRFVEHDVVSDRTFGDCEFQIIASPAEIAEAPAEVGEADWGAYMGPIQHSTSGSRIRCCVLPAPPRALAFPTLAYPAASWEGAHH
jgi:hypothetical protein